ncbi:DUF2441 domain-containing protein [Acinetobacter calcoaceticus]
MHTFHHVSYSKPYNSFPDFVENTQIVIGEQNNPFFNYFYNTNDLKTVTAGGEQQEVHYATELSVLAKGEHITKYPSPNHYLPYLYGKFSDLYTLNREMILENIRLQHYSHMPSRLKCLWVTTTGEECAVWFKHFMHERNMKLITFESEYEPVKVDSKFLPIEHDSLAEKERKAHLYWSSEMSESPMIEHLFVGTATVKRIEAA